MLKIIELFDMLVSKSNKSNGKIIKLRIDNSCNKLRYYWIQSNYQRYQLLKN